MAGQRHLMKHRRIVSDTSALHLPMSIMQQQPQQGSLIPQMTVNQIDDPLHRYVVTLVAVTITLCSIQATHANLFKERSHLSQVVCIFGPEGVPDSHDSCFCCCVCCYRFSKMPKAFLIRSGAQRNVAYTFVLILATDIPPHIFQLICS